MYKGEPNKKEFMKSFQSGFKMEDIWKDENNEFISQVFDLFDIDKNGTLSFDEFLVGNVLLANKDPNLSLESLFKILDIDKDGFLESKEVEHIFTAVRPLYDFKYETLPEDDAAALMQKLDLRKEGKISKEAFMNCLLHDPDFSKYFLKVKLLNGAFIIGKFYLQEPGFFDNKKRFDIL